MWDLPTVLNTLAKLGLYIGSLGASGLVMNASLFSAVRHQFRWKSWVSALAFLALGFATLSYSVRGIALTGELSGMLDPDMLSLLWQTPVGDAFALRAIGLLLLAIALWLPKIGMALGMLGAGITLWSFAEIGHVSDAAIWVRLLLFLHLAVASFWIGILPPLGQIAGQSERLSETAALGRAFGTLAAFLVPTLIIAGVIMAWLLVGGTRNLATAYGLTLMAKVAAVAVLLTLAAANKLRFVPAIAAGQPEAAQHLRNSIRLEYVAFAAVLLATSLLTSAVTLPQ